MALPGLFLLSTRPPPPALSSKTSFQDSSFKTIFQAHLRYKYHLPRNHPFPVRASSADSSSFSPSPNEADKSKTNKSLLTAVAIPLVSGLVVSAFNRPDKWYFELRKPPWTPPAPLFGLAWSLIYPLMGVASWGIWEQGGWEKQTWPLTLYALQLMANLLWQVAFFGLHSPALAFRDICVLAVLIALCIAAFRKVNSLSANLMKVYLAWVIFAALLNYTILYINTPPVAPA